MFWRYLVLSLLLGAPSNRILTSANAEYPSGGGLSDLSQQELLDDIVNKLVRQRQLEEQQQQQSNTQHAPPDPVNKKDSVVGVPDPNPDLNNNNGINSDSQPPADPASSGDTRVPAASQEGGSPAASGTKSEEKVVEHHQPGRVSALQYNPDKSQADRDRKFFRDDDRLFMICIGVVFSVGFIGLLAAGVCYYKYRRSAKAASDVEYPAYGVTGPMKERIPSPGDRKLAQSAQMYHYQHQKQQMIAMEKANGDMKHDASDDDSEEDNVEGDYTVYECPGLAPTGEMEVKNPLFRGGDAPVSASPPQGQQVHDGHGHPTDPPPPYRKESQ